MPIVHIVALKFKEGWTDEKLAEHFKNEVKLTERMPFLTSWAWGKNISLDSRSDCNLGMTHVVHVTCKDKAELDKYLPHPEHEAVKKIQGPMVADKFVVDLEIPEVAPWYCSHGLMVAAFAATFACGFAAAKMTN